MDWSKLPEVGAITLLTCAFAAVARHNHTGVSKLWLTAWLTIGFHFAASIFVFVPGVWGILANIIAVSALTWAGTLFMWAAIPYFNEKSSKWMTFAFLAVNTLYVTLIVLNPAGSRVLIPGALLYGIVPLAITAIRLHEFSHRLRWATITLYCVLSAFLLAFQNRPGNGTDLALNAVLFAVYFNCTMNFWYAYRRATAGAFITIAGFFTWASVFLVGPLMIALLPQVHVESEVWNLPKYVVAVGMILLMLEEQIAHNRQLALHDDLTGLPNRRLFQDRLASALERAHRFETQAALLVVDLDRFKQVNDTLGHYMGDLVLQHVSSILAGRVRRSDTVARTGGDEFSVILEPTSRADAEHVGQSLLRLLKEPQQVGDHTVRIGASVGVAVYPEDASSMESLCIAADLRMYDAKHNTGSFGKQSAPSAPSALLNVEPKTDPGLRVAK